MFKGSFVALVTPMLDNGEVDYESLASLVEFHIENNTDGVVAVGTTGESATLSFEQHIEVVRQVVLFANGRLPVIAGSGANSTEEAVFLTKQISTLDVDGLLSVVPYYNKPQQQGLVAHFTEVANASDLPLFLYNVPSRTVLDMNDETVVTLSKHANIVGLKDATGNIERFTQLKSAVDSNFLLFSGDDATGREFLSLGGDGVISVTANIAPAQMAKMCQLANANKFAEAKDVDDSLTELHRLLFVEPNPVLVKWALYKMGLIASPMLRLPMVLPELIHQSSIEQELTKLGLI